MCSRYQPIARLLGQYPAGYITHEVYRHACIYTRRQCVESLRSTDYTHSATRSHMTVPVTYAHTDATRIILVHVQRNRGRSWSTGEMRLSECTSSRKLRPHPISMHRQTVAFCVRDACECVVLSSLTNTLPIPPYARTPG